MCPIDNAHSLRSAGDARIMMTVRRACASARLSDDFVTAAHRTRIVAMRMRACVPRILPSVVHGQDDRLCVHAML